MLIKSIESIEPIIELKSINAFERLLFIRIVLN